MSKQRKRLNGAQVVLLVAAVGYTGLALADDDTGAPPPQTNPAQPNVGPAPVSNAQERTLEPVLEKPAPVSAPLSKREPTRTTMDKPLIDTYLRTWPEHAAKAAKATIAAYGLPNEATPSMLIWIQNGPWLKTTVYKDEVVHDFPRTHYDVVENAVRLQVPASRVNDVVAFEGSAVVKRTEGIVAVRSNSEAMNYLAINLIHDIAEGKRTTAQARKLYARGAMGIARAEPPVAATKLQFNPPDERAEDPDRPMLKNEYTEPGDKADAPAAPPKPPLPSPDDLRPGTGTSPGTDLNKAPPPKPSTPVAPPPAPKPVPGPKNSPGR